MRRQGTGMRGLQYMVLVRVDMFCLLLGRLAPQQKHDICAVFVYDVYDLCGELLPPAFCVTIGLAVLHRQACVEQEHALL